MMKSLAIFALATGLSVTAAWADDPRKGKADEPIVVAQACGWYIISGCFKSWNAASNKARQLGAAAFVVDTSSGQYPNFRPGWFCAAFGPYNDKWTAQSKSKYIKPSYVKNGC